jgi:RNA polymerase sigma-70 factor (family 1)
MKNSDLIQKLLLRIAKNDSEAFREFYDLFYASVYRFSGYYIKLEELRQETVSDVFFAIWQSRSKLPEISNIEAYLYTSTKNRANFYLRQNTHQTVAFDELPVDIFIHNETPEEFTINEELKRIIQTSIQDLPERCRLIFRMAREEGLKYRDIAEVLSISEKTVNAQMVTAIKKLGNVLQKYFQSTF